ncbi:CheR family methyltransferase [Sphingomonas nostoxanthinifaciens]|uniref:CheR family methyltransferase n=1 Tax=Sphingomonas nostoxanthinifaciens TaxID=2872652 RepID=UPI001CC213DD|nr:protein-glutamate O-methyltransferase CheR [Sphingomonas nostoxanthinifaciens]UAK26042.1 protein-glutamate O-methyltransferase CheR [Sphingomonas nostoxanthinifaciens]
MSALAVERAPGREFAFSPDDFRWISEFIYREAGIVLGEGKAQLVYSRWAKRLRASGCASFAAYRKLIETDSEERAAAVYGLTTNHTKFFREDHHFDHFVRETWPPLAARLNDGGKVRLWSAACSSGEEPYTLAMVAMGARRDVAASLLRRDLRILATDLSLDVLKIAREGRYPVDTLASVPGDLRSTWVQRRGDTGEIDPDLRALIAFRQLNLLGDWPIRGRFDAIFCRNVMIYFDDPTKARLQERLAAALAPGGFLYIGHSERLLGAAEKMLTPVGHTMYRKVAP